MSRRAEASDLPEDVKRLLLPAGLALRSWGRGGPRSLGRSPRPTRSTAPTTSLRPPSARSSPFTTARSSPSESCARRPSSRSVRSCVASPPRVGGSTPPQSTSPSRPARCSRRHRSWRSPRCAAGHRRARWGRAAGGSEAHHPLDRHDRAAEELPAPGARVRRGRGGRTPRWARARRERRSRRAHVRATIDGAACCDQGRVRTTGWIDDDERDRAAAPRRCSPIRRSTRASASRCSRRGNTTCRSSPRTAGALPEVAVTRPCSSIRSTSTRLPARSQSGARRRCRATRASSTAAASGSRPSRGTEPSKASSSIYRQAMQSARG